MVLDVHHEQPWMMMMMLMMMMTQPSYLWKTVQGNARNMSCLFFQIYIQETSGFEQQQKNEDLSPHNADII